LSSIGSQPTDQTAQVIGNILGGVTKLVAVGLGTAVTAADSVDARAEVVPPTPTPTTPICYKEDADVPSPNPGESATESAPKLAKEIKDTQNEIVGFERQLAGGVDEQTQKKLTAAIQAAQNLITAWESKLSFTIKATIDPGISPVQVDQENGVVSFTAKDTNVAADKPETDLTKKGNGTVDNSGLVALICPSVKEIDDLKVFSNWKSLMPDLKKSTCKLLPGLRISVYLDFPNAHSTPFDNNDAGSAKTTHEGPYAQTKVAVPNQLYREPGYIPVLVWRGVKPTMGEVNDVEKGPVLSEALMPPTTLPFGQFGIAQGLPFQADTFETLTWAITFQEDGQITNAAYSSKAKDVSLTSILFGSGASAANSIATEARAATTQANASAETEATKIQGQSDLIYQNERLKTCVVSPSACSQK
jgi:hypothetical protein